MPRSAQPAKPRSRRANGEGTTVPLPNGKQQHRVSYTRPDGSTARKSFTAPTAKAARARALAWVRQQARLVPDDSTLTVAQYAERWLRDRAPNRGTAWTVRNYEISLARLLPHIGGVYLSALGPGHIQPALTALSDGYAASTVRQTRKVLSTMLNDARRDRLIAVNPVPDTTPPRLPQRAEPPTFTPEQTARFLGVSEAGGDRDWPLWAVLLTTGLRIGEALGLRWVDVDFGGGTVAITGQVVRTETGVAERVPRTKSDYSRRVVPVGATVRRALAVQHARTGAGELVFVSGDGRAVNSVTTRRRFYAALEAAGLRRLHPHGGRHSVATTLISEGVPLRVVADILGHASVKTTGDVYAHVEAGTLRAAMAGLEAAIFGDPPTSEERRG